MVGYDVLLWIAGVSLRNEVGRNFRRTLTKHATSFPPYKFNASVKEHKGVNRASKYMQCTPISEKSMKSNFQICHIGTCRVMRGSHCYPTSRSTFYRYMTADETNSFQILCKCVPKDQVKMNLGLMARNQAAAEAAAEATVHDIVSKLLNLSAQHLFRSRDIGCIVWHNVTTTVSHRRLFDRDV